MLGSENSRSPEMLATKIGITHGRFSETGDQAVEGGRKYPDIFGIRSRSKQLLPRYSWNGGATVCSVSWVTVMGPTVCWLLESLRKQYVPPFGTNDEG